MDYDAGLQRAIYASLQQQFHYARLAAGGGGGGPSSRPSPANVSRPVAQAPPPPRYVPTVRERDIAPTAPRVVHGKRSTLAREGILPTPNRSANNNNNNQGGGGGTPGGGGGVGTRRGGGVGTPQAQQRQVVALNDDYPAWDDAAPVQDPDARPLPRPTDLITGWEEILSGGRVQRQARDGSHLLLVTEEPYTGTVNTFLRSDVVAIRGEGPLFRLESGTSRVAADGQASISAQVQNLGSRGRYVCCLVGVVLAPGEEVTVGITAASVHFDAAGSVFVSLDQWRVNPNTDGLDKVAVLQAPVPVRMLRDRIHVHVRVRSSWPHHLVDVYAQNEGIFLGIPLPTTTSSSSNNAKNGNSATSPVDERNRPEVLLNDVRPLFGASGGRVSLKSIVLSDPPPPPAASSSAANEAVIASSPQQQQPRPSTKSGYTLPQRQSSQPQQQQQPLRTGRSSSNTRGPSEGRPSRGGGGGGGGPAQSPLPGTLPPNVDPELAQRIEDEIMDRSPAIAWDDIGGVGDAKRLLNEAVVLPLLVPELFTGVLQPWKGVLLFGPPGTGKTMLAKAVAASAKTTFFNMSSSVLINKHLGESEKMVRTLFEIARARSPSTIFFDEVDAIMGARGGGNEHDAMRRVKTELLRQMDGLHAGSEETRVMVLATTNRPWDLDEAMRRRLEKRIYVPLPDLTGRLDILRGNAKKMRAAESVQLEAIARRTDGFSGADLQLLCRNAGMMPMRRLVEGKSPDQLAAMKARGEMVMGSVTDDDFLAALEKMGPSVGKESLVDYDNWTREFGST